VVSPFVLTVLKFAFLALLYFFVYRVVRSAAVELRGPKRRKAPAAPRPKRGGKTRPPVVVVVRSANGKKIASKKLRAPISIGRDESCDIRPDDTYISQFHARLFQRDGSWFVEDLGSTNGTYLNRQRISGTAEVHAGDEVRVGQTVLELRR